MTRKKRLEENENLFDDKNQNNESAKSIIEYDSITYCLPCSKVILETWKGWPHRKAVPMLPNLDGNECEKCGSSQSLSGHKITWLNCHHEFNTGLPDYWLLEIEGKAVKWGRPYLGQEECTRCGTIAVVSEMNKSSNRRELKINCAKCGLVKMRK
jgi:ribosomal protein S27AE